MLNTFMQAVSPVVIDAIVMVLGLIASYIGVQLSLLTKTKTQIAANSEIDQLRARLAEVIRNAALAAVANGLTDDSAWQAADYVRAGAPDTVNKLNVPRPVLHDRVKTAIDLAQRTRHLTAL